MNKSLSSLSTLLLVVFSFTGFAQSAPKKVFISHFTNTLCSVCASRNPGFHANILSQNNPDLIHVAYHPSRPYSACVFNQHNVSGNDDYATFLQVFGSTPRVVINGDAIPASQNYSDPTLFDPYTGMTSPIEVKLKQQKFGTDSMRVNIVVYAHADNNLGNQLLYLGLAERTISYNAPNGESNHFNVFRKALWGNEGTAIAIPTTAGDSFTTTVSTLAHPDWNMGQIFTYGFVQDASTREVYQSNSLSPNQQDDVPLGIGIVQSTEVRVFPVPVQNMLQIASNTQSTTTYEIYTFKGELLRQGTFTQNAFVNVSTFEAGVLFVVVNTDEGTTVKRVLKL